MESNIETWLDEPEDYIDLNELWDSLWPDERRFLLSYRACGIKAQAARRIGKTSKWIENRQRLHPGFRLAADLEELTGQEVVRRIMPDLLTLATDNLSEALTSNDVSLARQIEAAKVLCRLHKTVSGRK